ncbi:MAG: tetratricopeptide repeat protein [Methanosarcinaceae archaeon]
MCSLYAVAWYNKALFLLSLKKYSEAREHFKKAIENFEIVLEIKPDDVTNWQYKGNALKYLD